MTGLVLVVDDVPANVKLLEAKLTNEYFDVVTAKDGYEAIEQTKARMPDLILLDVMMPGMDGFETCRKLKQDTDVAHIPVVMVTALSDPSDRVQGLEAGADDFITKPINDTALFARVRSLVRIKVLIDELRLRDQSGAQFGTITDKFSLDMDVSGSKVMVIDDDVIQSRRMHEKLGSIGYSVEVFSEHNQALEYGKNAIDVDVIIISTQLADIDGLRLGTQFKAIEAMRNVPIIMLVDEDEQHLMLKALELGVNDYLITPIDYNEMFARVKTQVRRKQYQEALKSNYQESVSMAVTDGLTKLYNRHYLDTHMKNMVEQAQQGGRPMSVVIMDMDHFKSVNDTYGHDVGDEILIALAEIIVNTIRSADLAARFGGEEFVVLMPETDEARAYEAAERIRRNVEAFAFKVNHEVGQLQKTVSIGCATLLPSDQPETLLKRADSNLYEAKHAGRNRVCPVPAEGEGYELPPSRKPDYQPEVIPHMNAEDAAGLLMAKENNTVPEAAPAVMGTEKTQQIPDNFAYGSLPEDSEAVDASESTLGHTEDPVQPIALAGEAQSLNEPDTITLEPVSEDNHDEYAFIQPVQVLATATPMIEDVGGIAETQIEADASEVIYEVVMDEAEPDMSVHKVAPKRHEESRFHEQELEELPPTQTSVTDDTTADKQEAMKEVVSTSLAEDIQEILDDEDGEEDAATLATIAPLDIAETLPVSEESKPLEEPTQAISVEIAASDAPAAESTQDAKKKRPAVKVINLQKENKA